MMIITPPQLLLGNREDKCITDALGCSPCGKQWQLKVRDLHTKTTLILQFAARSKNNYTTSIQKFSLHGYFPTFLEAPVKGCISKSTDVTDSARRPVSKSVEMRKCHKCL